jgi:uncharacterized protein GlcG (DUF336 family)
MALKFVFLMHSPSTYHEQKPRQMLARACRERTRDPLHQRRSRMLTLSRSRQILDAAIRRAQQLGISISVAVCDRRGRLIALNQMDGSSVWGADRSSMGRAVAAAITGLPSERLIEHMQAHGPSSCSNVVPPRAQRGGLPIVEGGVVQGGCGVSGAATAELDKECASAGVAALDTAAMEAPFTPYAVRPSPSLSMASSA